MLVAVPSTKQCTAQSGYGTEAKIQFLRYFSLNMAFNWNQVSREALGPRKYGEISQMSSGQTFI